MLLIISVAIWGWEGGGLDKLFTLTGFTVLSSASLGFTPTIKIHQ